MLNLTPHPIRVGTKTLPPSGTVARVQTTDMVVGTCTVTGVPIVHRMFGDVTGLPSDSTRCLVSALILAAVTGRPGVYAPDTGPTAARDDRGQIVAVTRLITA